MFPYDHGGTPDDHAASIPNPSPPARTLPFISEGSREKAVEALSDFSEKDIDKIDWKAGPSGLRIQVGSLTVVW